MFRSKLAAVLAVAFLLSSGLVYMRAADLIDTQTRQNLEQHLQTARKNLERSRLLSDFATQARAEEIASHPMSAPMSRLAKILATPPETYADEEGNPPNDNDYRYKLHQELNTELKAWTARLEAMSDGKAEPAKGADGKPLRGIGSVADARAAKPDLFRVVDKDGIAMAGTHDAAWFGERAENGAWQGEEVEYAKARPAVATALQNGVSLRDIWIVNDAPMSVAVAPIRGGTTVLGAVIIGYRFTDAEAKRDKAQVDAEVAYFIGDRLSQTSTFDTQRERAVKDAIVGKGLHKEGATGTLEVTLRGERFLGMVGALSGYATAPAAGFVVLRNLDQSLQRAWGWSDGVTGALTIYIWVVPLFGLLLCIGIILGFFQRFMEPFEEIDRGVLEIINGDLDYWFDIPGKELPGTMSQNLNIMVCNLSGRPLPEDDDAVEGEHWAEERMFVDELDSSEFSARPVDSAAVAAGETGGLSAEVVQLVREDEESYMRRTFREYTQGLQKTGEAVQGITYEKFGAKLGKDAEALRAKYGCQQVRFLVEVGEDRVSLKPVPIN